MAAEKIMTKGSFILYVYLIASPLLILQCGAGVGSGKYRFNESTFWEGFGFGVLHEFGASPKVFFLHKPFVDFSTKANLQST